LTSFGDPLSIQPGQKLGGAAESFFGARDLRSLIMPA
jgi:hypothetical protein